MIQQAEATAEQTPKSKNSSNLESAKTVINAAAEDNAAYHDDDESDLLSEYVNDFFGPEGPYPVETSRIAWLPS